MSHNASNLCEKIGPYKNCLCIDNAIVVMTRGTLKQCIFRTLMMSVETVVAELNQDIYCGFISLTIFNCISNKDQDF